MQSERRKSSRLIFARPCWWKKRPGMQFSQWQSNTAGTILASSMIYSCYTFQLQSVSLDMLLVKLHWKPKMSLKTFQCHGKHYLEQMKDWRRFKAACTRTWSGSLPLQPSLGQRQLKMCSTSWQSSRLLKAELIILMKGTGKGRQWKLSWWMLLQSSKFADAFLGHYQVSKTWWILLVSWRLVRIWISIKMILILLKQFVKVSLRSEALMTRLKSAHHLKWVEWRWWDSVRVFEKSALVQMLRQDMSSQRCEEVWGPNPSFMLCPCRDATTGYL